MILTKEEILKLLITEKYEQTQKLMDWGVLEWEQSENDIRFRKPIESLADLAYRLRDQIIGGEDEEKIYRLFQSMDEVAGEKRPATWLLLKMQPIEMICAALLAEQGIKEGGEA